MRNQPSKIRNYSVPCRVGTAHAITDLARFMKPAWAVPTLRISKPAKASLIATTALVHGLTVVTRNVADFQSSGVSILTPWESQ